MRNIEDKEIVVGLDIGTTKICAVVGCKSNKKNKVEILGFGIAKSRGVDVGVVSNIRNVSEAIQEAITKASEMADIEIKSVYIGVAGPHIKTYSHSSGKYVSTEADHIVEKSDIDKLIKQVKTSLSLGQGEEIIHIFPLEYIIDGQSGITNPIGMSGINMELKAHIITGNISSLKNLKKAAEMVDIECADIILEPIASSFAVLTEQDKKNGVVLVDIGGGTTDVAVFYDGILRHTAVIPYAGKSITEDIMEGLRVIDQQAEELKIKYGTPIPEIINDTQIITIPSIHRGGQSKEVRRRDLSEIISARVHEIMEDVDSIIRSLPISKKLNAGVVLTGGGSSLQFLKEYTQLTFGWDVRIGYPDEHLEENSSLKSLTQDPSNATAIGLVIGAVKDIEDNKIENKVLRNNSTLSKNVIEEPVITPPIQEPSKPKKTSILDRFTIWLGEDKESKDY